MKDFDAHFEVELALQAMYEMCGDKEHAKQIRSISKMVDEIVDTQAMDAIEKEKWIAKYLLCERRKHKVLFEYSDYDIGKTYEFETKAEAEGFIEEQARKVKSSFSQKDERFWSYEYECRKGQVLEITDYDEENYWSWTLLKMK